MNSDFVLSLPAKHLAGELITDSDEFELLAVTESLIPVNGSSVLYPVVSLPLNNLQQLLERHRQERHSQHYSLRRTSFLQSRKLK